MSSSETDFDPDRVVIRDKRRLDPDSGELREQPVADTTAAETAFAPASRNSSASEPDRIPPIPMIGRSGNWPRMRRARRMISTGSSIVSTSASALPSASLSTIDARATSPNSTA